MAEYFDYSTEEYRVVEIRKSEGEPVDKNRPPLEIVVKDKQMLAEPQGEVVPEYYY